jgi:hypothetical protein
VNLLQAAKAYLWNNTTANRRALREAIDAARPKEWTPLQKASALPKTADQLRVMAEEASRSAGREVTPAEIEAEYMNADLWMNDVYQVDRRDCGPDPAEGRMIWLSIKRNRPASRSTTGAISSGSSRSSCGAEAEGVELYPAESRVVDTANQYHLWAFTKAKIEVGWQRGERMTPEQADRVGAKQRPGA